MNSTIFFRLIWKEFRQVRVIAVFVLGMGLLIQIVAAALTQGEGAGLIEGVAVIFPLLAMVVIASTIFSIEHENKSFLIQRLLPVTCRQIVSSKLFVTLASVMIIAGVFWLVASFYKPDTVNVLVTFFPALILVAAELLVWSIFFSLLSRNVLQGLALSVITAFSTMLLCMYLAALIADDYIDSRRCVAVNVLLRISLVLTIGILDVWLARRWFANDISIWKPSQLAELVLPKTKARASTKVSVGPVGAWWRLSWLQLRVSGVVLPALLAIAVALTIFETPGEFADYRSHVAVRLWICFVATMFGAFTGGVTFSAVQKYRPLLVRQGVAPHIAWVALLGPPLIIAASFAAWWSVRIHFSPSPNSVDYSGPITLAAVLSRPVIIPLAFIFVGFAVGQLVSQYSQSVVLGFCFSLLVGIFAYAWLLFLVSLKIPVAVSAVPIVLLTLLLSYLKTDSWLKGISGSRVQFFATLGGCIAILALLIGWRAFEIPPSDKSAMRAITSIAQPAVDTNSENWQESRELGDRVESLRRTGQERTAASSYSPQLVDEILNLEIDWTRDSTYADHRISGEPLPDRIALFGENPIDVLRMHWIYWELYQQLQWSIEQQDVDTGERILRYALKQELRGSILYHAYEWAELPDNDADRILSLLPDLDEYYRGTLGRLKKLEVLDWQDYARFLSLEPDVVQNIDNLESYETSRYLLLARLVFWERFRAQRAFDRDLIVRFRMLDTSDRNLHAGVSYEEASRQAVEVSRISRARDAFFVPTISDYDVVSPVYRAADLHGLLQLSLAISAWKHVHQGEYPAMLEQLVPDYLPQLPTNPFSSKGYHYFPNGINLSISSIDHQILYQLIESYPNGAKLKRFKPLLMSSRQAARNEGPNNSQSTTKPANIPPPISFLLEPAEQTETEK